MRPWNNKNMTEKNNKNASLEQQEFLLQAWSNKNTSLNNKNMTKKNNKNMNLEQQ